jgi:hypothetical protein
MRKGDIVTEAEMRRFMTRRYRPGLLMNETWKEREDNDRRAMIRHLAIHFYNLGCYDTEERIAKEREDDGIEKDLIT